MKNKQTLVQFFSDIIRIQYFFSVKQHFEFHYDLFLDDYIDAFINSSKNYFVIDTYSL